MVFSRIHQCRNAQWYSCYYQSNGVPHGIFCGSGVRVGLAAVARILVSCFLPLAKYSFLDFSPCEVELLLPNSTAIAKHFVCVPAAQKGFRHL
jgi:hypothetical protein